MTGRRIKIGIAGTHSTGKSTFIAAVATAATDAGLVVGRIGDLAQAAKDFGFPILTQHTADSTQWLMAECLRQAAEKSLTSDLILVDRPPLDALGYLKAATRISDRTIEPHRLEMLEAIAKTEVADYDLLVATVLDATCPLGEGRDRNEEFRVMAGEEISRLVAQYAPHAIQMTSRNGREVIDVAVAVMRAAISHSRASLS